MSVYLFGPLIAAYLDKTYSYEGLGGATLDLRVGKQSAALLGLMDWCGVSSAVCITTKKNYEAEIRLRAALEGSGMLLLKGEGRGSDPKWPPEASLLALGVDFADARRLADQFSQAAVVFAGADGVPQLCLGSVARSNLDWALHMAEQHFLCVANCCTTCGAIPFRKIVAVAVGVPDACFLTDEEALKIGEALGRSTLWASPSGDVTRDHAEASRTLIYWAWQKLGDERFRDLVEPKFPPGSPAARVLESMRAHAAAIRGPAEARIAEQSKKRDENRERHMATHRSGEEWGETVLDRIIRHGASAKAAMGEIRTARLNEGACKTIAADTADYLWTCLSMAGVADNLNEAIRRRIEKDIGASLIQDFRLPRRRVRRANPEGQGGTEV